MKKPIPIRPNGELREEDFESVGEFLELTSSIAVHQAVIEQALSLNVSERREFLGEIPNDVLLRVSYYLNPDCLDKIESVLSNTAHNLFQKHLSQMAQPTTEEYALALEVFVQRFDMWIENQKK